VGAQPKPRYQPTAEGVEQYGQWLVGQVGEDRRRQQLFVLQLATFMRHPRAALQILARYEHECLKEAQGMQVMPHRQGPPDGAPELAARLAGEERRLALGAKLEWVQYARRELNALADAPR
jgi:hypothetical protein